MSTREADVGASGRPDYLQGAHWPLCAPSPGAAGAPAAPALLALDDAVNLRNLPRAQEARKPGPQQIGACRAIPRLARPACLVMSRVSTALPRART